MNRGRQQYQAAKEELGIAAEALCFPLIEKRFVSWLFTSPGPITYRDLLSLWTGRVQKKHIPGWNLDQLRSIFQWIWQDTLQPSRRDISPIFKTLERFALETLELDGEEFFLRTFKASEGNRRIHWPFSLEESEKLLFWQTISHQVFPEFFMALFLHHARIQDPWDTLLRKGIVASRFLQDTFGNRLSEGHLHLGSCIRNFTAWEVFVKELPHHIFSSSRWPDLGNLDGGFSSVFTAGLLASFIRTSLQYFLLSRDQKILERIHFILWCLVQEGTFNEEELKIKYPETLFHVVHTLEIHTFLCETDGLWSEPVLYKRALSHLDTLAGREKWRFAAVFLCYLYCSFHFHRFFIQRESPEGLRFFTQLYKKNKILVPFHRSLFSGGQALKHHISPRQCVKKAEVRTSPDAGALSELLAMAELLKREKEENFKLGVICHFTKREDKAGDLREFFVNLREELNLLEDLLRQLHASGLPFHFVGIDVAGHETALPNWLFLPIFREFRLWWRTFFRYSGLGYTFHAGEDFSSLFQGLRHIGEILIFFPWGEGDRIGHGLALGYPPERGASECVNVRPLIDQLLDLIFEWSLGIYSKSEAHSPYENQIAQAIEELGNRLFEEYLPVNQWALFYRALFSPQTVLRILGRPAEFLGCTLGRGSENQRDFWSFLAKNEKVKNVLTKYLYHFDEYRKRAEPEFYVTHPEDRCARLERIQKWAIRKIAEKKVAIEACPTSNLFIRGLPSFCSHPALTLFKEIHVTINSDNILNFNTNLIQEISNVYYCEEKEGWSLELIHKLIENGNKFSFVREQGPSNSVF